MKFERAQASASGALRFELSEYPVLARSGGFTLPNAKGKLATDFTPEGVAVLYACAISNRSQEPSKRIVISLSRILLNYSKDFG